MDLSIIVVSYNTREITLECLRSIFRHPVPFSFEVVVLDNASTDGSLGAIAANFPQVKLISSEKNLGFARANNIAAERVQGRLLLLLNPDTVILDRAVERLYSFADENPQFGIWGGRTLRADLSLNPSSCWGRPTPWSVFCQALCLNKAMRNSRVFNSEAIGGWARDSVKEVDIVSGCFLMIRHDLWQQLDGFKSDFYMYGEDADLCLRAKLHGSRCLVCPDAAIIHYGGASEPVRADKMVRLFTAKRQLFERHWPLPAIRIGKALLRFWALTRLVAFGVAARVDKKYLDNYQAWSIIWARRAEWSGVSKV